MGKNGPIHAHQQFYSWAVMGPFVLTGSFTHGQEWCYVFVGLMDRIISFYLIFPYHDPLSPYHMQIHQTAPFLFLIPYPPHIFDRPWYYLVAPCLSFYQWLFPYLVRYIDSQSGGTVGFGLCPLRLVTLLARVS